MKLVQFIVAALLTIVVPFAMASDYRPAGGEAGDVACGGTDDSTAVATAIAAGSRVLLTGSVCRLKDVILASNVKISCAPGTVLKPLSSGAGTLFKGPTDVATDQDTFPHSWEISDCTVDLEKTHVSFIDVSNLPANTALYTNTIRGHRGYRIANNTIKYTDAPHNTSDTTTTAFSYIKASCVTATNNHDVDYVDSDYQHSPCRIENNNILGSQVGRGKNTLCGNTTSYSDTGLELTFVNRSFYSKPEAGTMLISENAIQGVESSALKITGPVYSVILADNGFQTCRSEEPIMYSTSASNFIGWSQTTGNQFSAIDNSADQATEIHIAGANNQVVGNTFQASAQPVLGTSVNFVGNYTAGAGVWLMTDPASDGFDFTTQNVINAHTSFIGNVGTARIYVTNPQDLVIANNKMLGVDVGVEIKVDVTDTVVVGDPPASVANEDANKLGRVAITGNVFNVKGDATDTYVVIDFVGTDSVDRDFHDTVITGNVIGNHGDGTADAKPSKCFGGGAALFNYKALSITGNTLECDATGYPDTFTSASNADTTFCNTSSLFGDCPADGEIADEQAFALPTTKISSVTASLRDVSVKYDLTCTDCSGTGRNVDGNVGILTLPVPASFAFTGQELAINAGDFASGDIMLLPLGTTIATDGVGNCAFCTDSGTDTQYGCALKEDAVLNLEWNTSIANKWNIVSCYPSTGDNALTGMLTPMVETAVQSLTGTTTSNENLAANAGFIWADNTTSGNLRLASTGVNDPGASADGKKVRIMVDPTATHHVQWLTVLAGQTGSLFDPANAATVCAAADHNSMCNFLLGCTIDPGQAIEVEWDETATKWELTDCWGYR